MRFKFRCVIAKKRSTSSCPLRILDHAHHAVVEQANRAVGQHADVLPDAVRRWNVPISNVIFMKMRAPRRRGRPDRGAGGERAWSSMWQPLTKIHRQENGLVERSQ